MKKIVCLVLLCMSLFSCNSDYKLHALMNEWIGKKLVLNDDARKAMNANDSLRIDYTATIKVRITPTMQGRFSGEITFRCNDVDSIKTMLVKGMAK